MPESESAPIDAGALTVAASGVVVVVGAALGWFFAPVGAAAAPLDGVDLFAAGSPVFNGVVTSVLAAAATVLALGLSHRRGANVATAVAGAAIELIAAAFLLAPAAALGPLAAGTEVPVSGAAVGVYVTLLGGLGVLLGSVVSYRR